MTDKEFIAEAKIWGLEITQQEIDEARGKKQTIPVQVIGVFDPMTGILHPWRITPSSEDKGYCNP